MLTKDESVVTAVLTNVPDVGSVTLVAAVVVKVKEKAPDVARVEPSAKVKVDPVAGAVIVTLLMDVAEATPNVGVTSVGEFDNTLEPDPVDVVTPVPPLATLSVPLSVIAPVVAEFGVNPVVPALNDVTPPVDAAHVAVVPLDVST